MPFHTSRSSSHNSISSTNAAATAAAAAAHAPAIEPDRPRSQLFSTASGILHGTRTLGAVASPAFPGARNSVSLSAQPPVRNSVIVPSNAPRPTTAAAAAAAAAAAPSAPPAAAANSPIRRKAVGNSEKIGGSGGARSPAAALSSTAPAMSTPSSALGGVGQGVGAGAGAAMGGGLNSYETPRKVQGRPDDLHMTDLAQYSSPARRDYNPSTVNNVAAPGIHLQQATPQTATFGSPASSTVPGVLQPGPGASSRPSTSSSAYSNMPAMAPLNTNAQQYTPSSSSGRGANHGHSRSSPSGIDHKYIPFSATPTKSTNFSPQTPSMPSHSPLGLHDIRPRANSDMEGHGVGFTNPMDYMPSQTKCSYMAPWATYAYDWCKWPVQTGNSCGKMAVGSYLEDAHNFIQIVDTQLAPQDPSASNANVPPYGVDFVKVAEATCAYPVTRISWEPPSSQKPGTDLLATSGDHLRLWSLPQGQPSALISNNINRSSVANSRDNGVQKLQPLALLSNSKTPEHTAPLTSLDWNTLSPKLIITSSIDTTCTIWDIPTLTAKTQLIAHDKEVFDVRFCAGSVDVFVSCGADGSVRMFDLRSLEHSTIIYEPSEKSDKGKMSPPPSSPTKSNQTLSSAPPLLRLAASPHDAHLLATFAADSNLVRILDARQPGTALLELQGHSASLNSIEWNPSRRGMLASGADDSLVLVWDLLNSAGGSSINGASGGAQAGEVQAKGPSASWRCDYEVANLSWAPQSSLTGQGGDWLGVCGGRGVWGVKL